MANLIGLDRALKKQRLGSVILPRRISKLDICQVVSQGFTLNSKLPAPRSVDKRLTKIPW